VPGENLRTLKQHHTLASRTARGTGERFRHAGPAHLGGTEQAGLTPMGEDLKRLKLFSFPLCHGKAGMQLNSKFCIRGSSVAFEGTSGLVIKHGRDFTALSL